MLPLSMIDDYLKQLEWTQWAFLFLCTLLTCYGFYVVVLQFDCSNNKHKKYFRGKTALLVIAHPDDECMFFGPAIVNLVKSGCNIYVLCLSSGNHNNLGQRRKDELRESCKCLGIPTGNVTIIQHSKLPDNPKAVWSRGIVGNLILKYTMDVSADFILSFDQYGVSGHSNHKCVHNGLMYLINEEMLPRDFQVFVLESVNRIRKYSSFLDVPMSYIAGDLTFVADYNEVNLLQKAMRAHKSQYVWFRRLYLLFSRYLYINTFKALES